jgi:hypothetical protein
MSGYGNSGLQEVKYGMDSFQGPLFDLEWVRIETAYAFSYLNWNDMYSILTLVPPGSIVYYDTFNNGVLKFIKSPRIPLNTNGITNSEFIKQLENPEEYEDYTLYKLTDKRMELELIPEPLSHLYNQVYIPRRKESKYEEIHLILDVVGMAPILGEPADAINSVLYFSEGDNFNGGISALAVVPGVIGNTATGAKYAGKFRKARKYSSRFSYSKYADDLLDLGKRGDLRKNMSLGRNVVAHHIIPWELRHHDLVQHAARGGFKMNNVINGIALGSYSPLETKFRNFVLRALKNPAETQLVNNLYVPNIHASHRAYNDVVELAMDKFVSKVGGIDNISPDRAKVFLERTLIQSLEEKITMIFKKNSDINRQDFITLQSEFKDFLKSLN